MNVRLTIAALLALLITLPVKAEEARVNAADLSMLAGAPWTGALSYLDYSSGTTESIPVSIQFDTPRGNKIVYRIKYPGEAQYNTSEKLRISAKGKRLNGERVTSRSVGNDGSITVVTEFAGKDDGQSADIRMTYTLHANKLEIRKEVRSGGDGEFFERNAYRLSR